MKRHPEDDPAYWDRVNQAVDDDRLARLTPVAPHRLTAVVLPKREARGDCSCGDSAVITNGSAADLEAWHRQHKTGATT